MTLLPLLRLAVPAPRRQSKGRWQLWAAANVSSNEWVMGAGGVVTRPAVTGASVCNIAVLLLNITQYSGVMTGG